MKSINNTRVAIYRNLHKEGHVYSVRSEETKRVVAWVSSIVLTKADFKVGQTGRRRVLKEKRKNVHAFIKGTVSNKRIKDVDGWVKVGYNPYKSDTFVDSRGRSVLSADFVVVNGANILAKGITYENND